MATLIQTGPSAGTGIWSSGSSFTAAYNSNITSGSGLFALIRTGGTGQTVSSITDSLGNVWVKAKSNAAQSTDVEIWYALSSGAGANTLTINLAGTITAAAAIIGEVGQFDASSTLVVDVTQINSGNSTSPSSGTTAVPHTSGEFAVVVLSPNGATPTAGPTNSYTSIAGPNASILGAYLFLGSAAATSTGWTFASAQPWNAAIAVFQVQVGRRATRVDVEVLSVGNPKARVTREDIEVLSTGNPKARVTRVSVEVLRSTTNSVPAPPRIQHKKLPAQQAAPLKLRKPTRRSKPGSPPSSFPRRRRKLLPLKPPPVLKLHHPSIERRTFSTTIFPAPRRIPKRIKVKELPVKIKLERKSILARIHETIGSPFNPTLNKLPIHNLLPLLPDPKIKLRVRTVIQRIEQGLFPQPLSKARVTQETSEVIATASSAVARVTQETAEVIGQSSTVNAIVTQETVEVIAEGAGNTRLTQEAAEVIAQAAIVAVRVTQQTSELMAQAANVIVRLTQIVAELLTPLKSTPTRLPTSIMAIPWPANLPQVLEGGATEVPGAQSLRSTVKSYGFLRARFMGYYRTRVISGELRLLTGQRNVLEDFYKNDLAGGALTFQAGLDNTGVTKNYKFVKAPRYVPEGDHYMAQVAVQIVV